MEFRSRMFSYLTVCGIKLWHTLAFWGVRRSNSPSAGWKESLTIQRALFLHLSLYGSWRKGERPRWPSQHPHHTLQSLPVRGTRAAVAGRDAACQDALHRATTEGGEDGRGDPLFCQPPEEVHPLLCVLEQLWCVQRPKRSSAMWTSRNFVLMTLRSGMDLKSTIISWVKLCPYTTSPAAPPPLCRLSHHCWWWVPPQWYHQQTLMIWFQLDLAVQTYVTRVKSRGLSTQPWGTPVLSVMAREVLVQTRTVCGLSDKKSKIQLQKWVFGPNTNKRLIQDTLSLVKAHLGHLEKEFAANNLCWLLFISCSYVSKWVCSSDILLLDSQKTSLSLFTICWRHTV